MMRASRIALVVLIGCWALVATRRSTGQPLHTQRYVPVELTFTSDRAYAHPHRDVDLIAVFEGPDGARHTVGGFWDGGAVYRVRFAPPAEGTWHYHTIADDARNTGLHGQHGRLSVAPYTGDDPFARHGWLRVSDNRRHLTHEDGLPFFYLADTAWEITWKSYREQVTAYLDDRCHKGFNAVQLVVMSHQRLRNHGVRNRYGEPFFLDDDFSRLNPRYFDYLDWIVEEINRRGMVAVLVPLWAYMMDLYPETGPQRNKLSQTDAFLVARYTGARYAGHNVMWFIGGDNQYDTPERKAFWTQFAAVLRAASGGRHLTTVHPLGYTASFDYFNDGADWLDFHTYQSSHVAGGFYTWTAAGQGYGLRAAKPVLNGEAVYEDIYHNLWAPGDTRAVRTFRIRPEHVRQASYESILAGALVGITYGANGVWQWHTEALPGSHEPRFSTEQAWHFPGSTHMSLLKHLMIRYRWYEMQPFPQALVGKEAPDFLSIAASDSHMLAYFPTDVETATLNFARLGQRLAYHWIDPATGDSTNPITTDGQSMTVRKPQSGDMVLVAEILVPLSSTTTPPFFVDGVAPNPFAGETTLNLALLQAGTIRVTVWDLLGRRLLDTRQAATPGLLRIPLRVPHAGLYVYRMTFSTESGQVFQKTGEIVSVGGG